MFLSIKMTYHANEKYCLIESIDQVQKTISCNLKIDSLQQIKVTNKMIIAGKIQLKDLEKTDMKLWNLRKLKRIGLHLYNIISIMMEKQLHKSIRLKITHWKFNRSITQINLATYHHFNNRTKICYLKHRNIFHLETNLVSTCLNIISKIQ